MKKHYISIILNILLLGILLFTANHNISRLIHIVGLIVISIIAVLLVSYLGATLIVYFTVTTGIYAFIMYLQQNEPLFINGLITCFLLTVYLLYKKFFKHNQN